MKQESGSAGWRVPVLAHSALLDLTSDLDSSGLPLLLTSGLPNGHTNPGADDRPSSHERASPSHSGGHSFFCLSPGNIPLVHKVIWFGG